MDPVSIYTGYKVAKSIPIAKIAIAICLAFVVLFASMGMLIAFTASPDNDMQTNNCVAVAPASDVSVEDLTAEQSKNAAIVVSTAKSLGLSTHAEVIGIAVALAESNLKADLTEAQSDRDSAGLFQQRRPWGPLRFTAEGSSKQFYTGGAGGQPGLMDITGWEQMSVGRAGQAVQRSAFPTGSNYTAKESLAREIVASINSENSFSQVSSLSTACSLNNEQLTSSNFTLLAGKTQGEAAVNAAAKWLGTPYSWGGGTYAGPSRGIAHGANTVGFDCSGLILHAWYQGSGGSIKLPHSSATISAITTPVPKSQIQAGDILSFAQGGRVYHDGLYDGRGNMIHAPRTGKTVEIVPDVLNDPYWSSRLVSITRP